MPLGRTFVGSCTKIQCGSQSHLSYAWLDDVRKLADLWGSWRTRCWNNIESYFQDLEEHRTIWFSWLMATVCLFLNLSHCWVRDQRRCKKSRQILPLVSFPASISLSVLCLLSARLCVTYWGVSGRLKHSSWLKRTKFL